MALRTKIMNEGWEMVDTKKLDAMAYSYYEMHRLLREYDPVLADYIEQIGNAYQANDMRAIYSLKKKLRHMLADRSLWRGAVT